MKMPMDLTEVKLRRKDVFEGKIMTVHVDDVRLPIQVDRELCDEFTEPVCLDFEAAGPRKKLYFDPSRAKCAIVTCGGLCPGLNDVIRAIVMEAHHAYHVPASFRQSA